MTPERIARLEYVLAHRQPGLTVVLENVNDPHNISAVMRTCDAVGIQEIFVLNNRIEPHKKWGNRSSSSADKWVTVHQFTDTSQCFLELRKRFEAVYTTHLSGDAKDLYDLDLKRSTALIFGNEHDGITEETRRLADGNFVVPQVGIIQSLNISVACAVSIYEGFRQKRVAGHYTSPRLEGEQMEQLRKDWGL